MAVTGSFVSRPIQLIDSIASQLEIRHAKLVDRPWLGPKPNSRVMIATILVLCFLAAIANLYVRHNQSKVWDSNPDVTYIDGAPAFSTADAPLYLGHARAAVRGEDVMAVKRLRAYPQHAQAPSESEYSSIFDRPLLSVLIAFWSKDDSVTSLLTSAHLVTFGCTFATVVFVFTAFGIVGYWFEGAVAAVGGGLSTAYLVRSSIGRIDTDQMNLGFMYMMLGMVYLAFRARNWKTSLIYGTAAGLFAYVFMWWYGKPQLVLLGALSLGWLLFVRYRNLHLPLAACLLFLAAAGITFFNPFATVYTADVFKTGTLIFPKTLDTVTEVQQVPFSQILVFAAGSIEMGMVCLVGLSLFLIRHPVTAIAYSPLVGLGLLNFFVGNRAIFYSAPMLWFGAAFLLTSTARFIAFNLSDTLHQTRRDTVAIICGACLGLVIVWANSATGYLPRTSFPKPTLEGLTSLRTTADPSNSVVATWWDYGYASMFLNELPTIHDGGSQTRSPTHFVAQSLLDADQHASTGTLKFLVTRGLDGIAQQENIKSLKVTALAAADARSPDLYLVVTDQMA